MQKCNTELQCSQTKIHLVILFYTALAECQHHIKDCSLTKLSSTLLTKNTVQTKENNLMKSDRDLSWKRMNIRMEKYSSETKSHIFFFQTLHLAWQTWFCLWLLPCSVEHVSVLVILHVSVKGKKQLPLEEQICIPGKHGNIFCTYLHCTSEKKTVLNLDCFWHSRSLCDYLIPVL